MTLEQNIEKLHSIFKEFESVASTEPYDPEAGKAVIEKLRIFQRALLHTPRRQPWFALFFCLAMLSVLLLIMYWILSLLWVRGTI